MQGQSRDTFDVLIVLTMPCATLQVQVARDEVSFLGQTKMHVVLYQCAVARGKMSESLVE